jgi:hypothetical protein
MSMRFFKTTSLAVVVVIALALGLDRVSLAIWRWRVESFAERLTAAAKTLKQHRSADTSNLLSWSGDRSIWAVPYLELALTGPQPAVVTVDGNGGLDFTYVPPLLAWSRHVPWAFTRPALEGADVYAYNDVYILKIATLDDRPNGHVLPSPSVTLDHGFPF